MYIRRILLQQTGVAHQNNEFKNGTSTQWVIVQMCAYLVQYSFVFKNRIRWIYTGNGWDEN